MNPFEDDNIWLDLLHYWCTSNVNSCLRQCLQQQTRSLGLDEARLYMVHDERLPMRLTRNHRSKNHSLGHLAKLQLDGLVVIACAVGQAVERMCFEADHTKHHPSVGVFVFLEAPD